MKFPILEKIADLMKDLKCEHQSIFPCGKLNFRDSTENQILFLKNLATVKFFTKLLKNDTLTQKNHYPPRWICITHIWSHTLFPRRILIFQGVLAKLNFLTKFPHLEKFIDLMTNLKYEDQSIFPLWGRVKLNFRNR